MLCFFRLNFCSGSVDPTKAADLFNQEVSLTYRFSKYPYFCKFLGYDDEKFIILLKYYALGSLSSYMKNPQNAWSKRLVMDVALGVSRGIKYMHIAQIAHCDIKPENVLLEMDKGTNRLNAVLTDFGITRVLTAPTEMAVKHFKLLNIRGASFPYAAPEVLYAMKTRRKDGSRLDDTRSVKEFKAGDVYAFGGIVFDGLNRFVKCWESSQSVHYSAFRATQQQMNGSGNTSMFNCLLENLRTTGSQVTTSDTQLATQIKPQNMNRTPMFGSSPNLISQMPQSPAGNVFPRNISQLKQPTKVASAGNLQYMRGQSDERTRYETALVGVEPARPGKARPNSPTRQSRQTEFS